MIEMLNFVAIADLNLFNKEKLDNIEENINWYGDID